MCWALARHRWEEDAFRPGQDRRLRLRRGTVDISARSGRTAVLYLVGGWRVWKTWTVEVAAPGADVLTFHWSHAKRLAAGD